MLTDYLQQLMQKGNLTSVQGEQVLSIITNGAKPEQTAALLTLLHNKPETAEELIGFVRGMKKQMIPVSYHEPLLDIVGTGGDGANTINISTASALVIASLGIKVAKHGNRSVSSKCGSADFLESLDIPIHLSPHDAQKALNHQGFAFLYAPDFHPAMQAVKNIRQALGIRTTFNLLGPLLNPATPSHLIIGVYEKRLMDIFADTLQKLPIKRALVVHGSGLDEINCLGSVDVIEVTPSSQQRYSLNPNDFGLPYCRLSDLQGGTSSFNRTQLMKALSGEASSIHNTIIFNVGVALHLVNSTITIQEGITLATRAAEDGTTLTYIKHLKESNHAKQLPTVNN